MRRLLTVLAAVLLLAGCSSPAGSPSVTALPTTAPASPPEPPTITLAFAGDVHFHDRTAPLLNDPATAFGPVAEIFQAADYALVNMETSVASGGSPQPKGFTFRAPPGPTWEAIKAAGIDAVSLGNNHALDFGRDALAETFATAQAAGVPVFGAGPDADAAYGAIYAEVKGVKIAFLAASQVNELNTEWVATDDRSGVAIALTPDQLARVAAEVRAAKARADVVVVFMHWGVEGTTCPAPLQEQTAQLLVDAGATMIIGAHPHRLQGSGWLGSTFVAYSLGNFLWYVGSVASGATGVLTVTLTGSTVTGSEFIPARIAGNGQPIPLTGDAAAQASAAFADLRSCTDLAPAPAP